MSGLDLLNFYTSQRDYSGSDADQYAQTLMTIWSNLHEKTYPLLEEAEAQGKKLQIKTVNRGHPLLNDELTEEDIIWV